jgi:mono/diheme cytochrome c family protein
MNNGRVRLVMLAAAALAGWPAAAGAQDGAAIELGKEVYRAQRCARCHAIGGVGSRRSPLDGVGDRLTEAEIRKWIVAPQTMNPKVRKRAYDKLPPKELDALVAYMMSLKQR